MNADIGNLGPSLLFMFNLRNMLSEACVVTSLSLPFTTTIYSASLVASMALGEPIAQTSKLPKVVTGGFVVPVTK